jgi:type III pantothenate kinase
MLLAIDIGNSDITIGVYDQFSWIHIWRIPAVVSRPELFYGIKLRDYFLEADIKPSNIQHIVISSVVPDLTDKIINITVTLFESNPLVLGKEVYQKLPIQVLNPYEIGSDLVANAMAAYTRFNRASVVVDFGTALTFTVLSDEGAILGVAIAPGLKTAIRSLSQNAARLFDVPLSMPSSVLGKSTVHAIQAGIFYGYEGVVKNILDKIRQEVRQDISTIATGGLSGFIPSLKSMVDVVDPHLTLEGLRLIRLAVDNP